MVTRDVLIWGNLRFGYLVEICAQVVEKEGIRIEFGEMARCALRVFYLGIESATCGEQGALGEQFVFVTVSEL